MGQVWKCTKVQVVKVDLETGLNSWTGGAKEGGNGAAADGWRVLVRHLIGRHNLSYGENWTLYKHICTCMRHTIV